MNPTKNPSTHDPIRLLLAAAAAAVLGSSAPQAAIVGQWDFNNGTLAATAGGQALGYLDGPGGATETQTSFETSDIGGQAAKVMKFPACVDSTMGYTMPTPAQGNGGGELLNQWTLIVDVMFPTASDRKWRGIFEADNRLTTDSDFFINTSNGIGISGSYAGNVTPDVWHRIGVVIDQSVGVNQIRKYLDGVLVGVQAAGGLEGRWAPQPNWYVELFNDNDGEAASGYVNSIQFRNEVLTDGQMLALGGPAATGIPQTIPSIPSFVESRTPDINAANVSPKPLVQVVLNGGSTTVAAGSIKLLLDDQDTAAQVTPAGVTFTATHQVSSLLASGSSHKLSFIWQDNAAGLQTNAWNFTVGQYTAITLPPPFVLETFDTTAEGGVPAGWVATNLTDSLTGSPDLDNPNSDSYMDWTVITSNRVSQVFGARRLNMGAIVVNNEPLTSLVSGSFAYAESDNRGGSQVQVLISPDFTISGKSDIFLSFHSMYEQNQDSLGAVEYSIDEGQTWLPALYMLDVPDIVTDAETKPDAVATFNNARGDAAHASPYGTFIGAAVTADLGPFLSGRINDDQVESKRVELLRLEKADGQAKVRLRFLQTGTGSWYFGIDDVGLYSISKPLPPTITTQPISQVASVGGTVTLSVAATGKEPITYQWKRNDVDVPGGTAATLTLANFSAAQAGDYTVVVTNPGGSTTSQVAQLQAFSGPITQNLVVHLKFDGDANDSSAANHDGTEIGTPSYDAGKVGRALHLLTSDDYVSLGAPDDLDFGIDVDFAIAFWTKVTAFNGDPAFVSNKDWDSGGNQGYVLATDDDGHFQWNVAGAPGGRKDYDGPPGTFTDQAWHHVVVNFQRAGNASTYIDGVLRDSRSLTANQNNVDTPSDMATNIGQDGTGVYGSRFTDVQFDDVGIWRRILTPQEIAGIFEAGQAGKDLSTVVISGPGDAGTLGIAFSGGKVVLTWDSGATLQASSTVTGGWADVAGASPVQVDPIGAAKYYRLRK